MAESTASQVMAELAVLEDPKVRAVNLRHGDDHGVNIGELRALAKRLKKQPELVPVLKKKAALVSAVWSVCCCLITVITLFTRYWV